MRLDELLPFVDPVEVHGPQDVQVDHVTRDSREAGRGVVFVAIRGGRFDGHDAVEAVASGVVVVERAVPVQPGVTCVVVGDTRLALARLGAAIVGHPAWAMPVVGVTGTNGKTTVTTLCEGAMAGIGRVAGRIGTLGARWNGVDRATSLTTPEAHTLHALLAEMRDAGAQAAFIEVSSMALVQRRAESLPFHTVVFTNLGRDHLDDHGTFDKYVAAKAMLFAPERLRDAGGAPRAILCGDDPLWQRMAPPADHWTYGFGVHNDAVVLAATLVAGGQQVRVRVPGGDEVELISPLVGRHNALNLAAALLVLHTVGVSWQDAAAGLATVQAVPGRLEPVPDADGRLILVDYAHTPDALEAVLSGLREGLEGRLWVVFGCGGDRDPGKRPLMGQVAARWAHEVVVTSDNPRSEDPQRIVDDILQGVDRPVHVEVDRRRAIALALGGAAPGDVVVIAGKGHETTQEIAGVKLPFDDRQVARDALEAR